MRYVSIRPTNQSHNQQVNSRAHSALITVPSQHTQYMHGTNSTWFCVYIFFRCTNHQRPNKRSIIPVCHCAFIIIIVERSVCGSVTRMRMLMCGGMKMPVFDYKHVQVGVHGSARPNVHNVCHI